MLRKINSFFAVQSAAVITCLSCALILLVAAIDHVSGDELSASIFFLVPISITAWYATRGIGYTVSLLSAAAWMLVEYFSPHQYSQAWILLWNSLVRLGFFLVVAYLLTELRSHLERHREMASTDSLTGLLNRNGFFQRARIAINSASRYGYEMAIAYIDLDGFKRINDTLGHQQGDEALTTIASLLRGSSRESDVVARIGGDEFVVLLPDTSLSGANAYFAKLHTELHHEAATRGWSGLGFSIGAVVFAKAPADLGDALKLADTVMYRVKQSGRSGVIVEGAAAAPAAC